MRLAPYLRLMRFPLVFTVIGDAWAVRWMAADVSGPWGVPPVGQLALLAGVSFCLYAFGMVLNDVLDARHDALNFPARSIPSGQVKRARAGLLAIAFALAAGALAWPLGRPSFDIAVTTALLILAYNGGLKRVPLLGLLLLGLIRAVQCQLSAVAGDDWNAPIWNSLFLFTHVTVVSWIAYNWEGKRPPVGRWTRWGLAFAIVLIDFAIFDAYGLRSVVEPGVGPVSEVRSIVSPGPFLVLPLIAAAGNAAMLLLITFTRRLPSGPEKGRMAMRIGLPWLLVYGAAFCAAAGRWAGAVAIALLLACVLASMRAMRGVAAALSAPPADASSLPRAQ
jgi:hypothetical protein